MKKFLGSNSKPEFTYKNSSPQSNHTSHYSNHAFLAARSVVLVGLPQQLYWWFEKVLADVAVHVVEGIPVEVVHTEGDSLHLKDHFALLCTPR